MLSKTKKAKRQSSGSNGFPMTAKIALSLIPIIAAIIVYGLKRRGSGQRSNGFISVQEQRQAGLI